MTSSQSDGSAGEQPQQQLRWLTYPLRVATRKFHDQNRVLCRETYERHQTDLEVDVVGQTTQISCQQCTEDRKRHSGNDCQWQAPAFILGGKDQEHHEQAEDHSLTTAAACRDFLIGGASPAI